MRIAVAESLTGGLLVASLISVPGASTVIVGGVVAYNLAVKSGLLGVSASLLSREGAVHPQVATEMALGVRGACKSPDSSGSLTPAEIGISTTGVAGPDPDPHTGAPAGTVWLGMSDAHGDGAVELRLNGTRDEIRWATVEGALRQLKAKLESL